MTASEEPAAREPLAWRHALGISGWLGLLVAVYFLIVAIVQLYVSGIGLALGAGGMESSNAAAITLMATITAFGTAAIAIIAAIARRWVLLPAALVVCALAFVLANGAIATG
ncbi:MAG: hypothetical protein ACQEW8_10045 [Actinomycetota bacterium]